MPYNTRRKSLSLPSLGIHVPVTHAERAAANRASPNGNITSNGQRRPSPSSNLSSVSNSPSSVSTPSMADNQRQHPNKKMKRSHGELESSQSPSGPESLPRKQQHRPPQQQPQHGRISLDNTPPPSPKTHRAGSVEMLDVDADPNIDTSLETRTVDLEGINDEIVAAVIVQLQNTGNRPHLVKELAAILMLQLKIVQQSANPCAIISSRLSTYLKRPCWSALSPCPLAKELETVHPRRTYFYLTTRPHQPLPDPSVAPPPLIQRAIITPSLSSAGPGSEDADEERRRELSPSPEIDLSAEFDDMDDDIPMPATPIGSLPNRMPQLIVSSAKGARGTSPPLERDEKEFTQTANVLQQKRKASSLLLASAPVEPAIELNYNSRDENLFGGQQQKTFAPVASSHSVVNFAAGVTSPAVRPSFELNLKRDSEAESWAKLDSMLEWDRSPETIELEELDGLLDDF